MVTIFNAFLLERVADEEAKAAAKEIERKQRVKNLRDWSKWLETQDEDADIPFNVPVLPPHHRVTSAQPEQLSQLSLNSAIRTIPVDVSSFPALSEAIVESVKLPGHQASQAVQQPVVIAHLPMPNGLHVLNGGDAISAASVEAVKSADKHQQPVV